MHKFYARSIARELNAAAALREAQLVLIPQRFGGDVRGLKMAGTVTAAGDGDDISLWAPFMLSGGAEVFGGQPVKAVPLALQQRRAVVVDELPAAEVAGVDGPTAKLLDALQILDQRYDDDPARTARVVKRMRGLAEIELRQPLAAAGLEAALERELLEDSLGHEQRPLLSCRDLEQRVRMAVTYGYEPDDALDVVAQAVRASLASAGMGKLFQTSSSLCQGAPCLRIAGTGSVRGAAWLLLPSNDKYRGGFEPAPDHKCPLPLQ